MCGGEAPGKREHHTQIQHLDYETGMVDGGL